MSATAMRCELHTTSTLFARASSDNCLGPRPTFGQATLARPRPITAETAGRRLSSAIVSEFGAAALNGCTAPPEPS